MIQKLAFFFLIQLAVGIGISYAADDATDQLPGKLRQFDQRKLDSLREKKDFTYEVTPTPDAGWKEQLYNKLTKLFSHKGFATFWQVFPYALVAIMIMVVVMSLLNASVGGFVKSEGSSTKINYKVEEDHIDEIDFEREIAHAIEQKLFRKAVRLHYLRTLKKLSDNKLILWKVDKTNQDYSKELRVSSLHLSFSQITFVFEECWYGNHTIDHQSFETIKLSFSEFERQIERKNEKAI
jgi:hypothetical protein